MKHASVLDWSPHGIVELGLFDDIDPFERTLAEAPIVTLVPGEALTRSRSGEPLLVVPIRGTLRVVNGDTSSTHGPGALIGLAEVLVSLESSTTILAETDTVVLLLDIRRVAQLVALSPHFSQVLIKHLQAPVVRNRAVGHATCPDLLCLDQPTDGTFDCVVLVRLLNHSALDLCYGARAVEQAMIGLETAVRQSIRPSDRYLLLSPGECIVGLQGDMLSASIVASRLLSRASRVVVFGDMHMPLPHLQVVLGIDVTKPGETLRAVIDRARSSARQATRVGATVGGALA